MIGYPCRVWYLHFVINSSFLHISCSGEMGCRPSVCRLLCPLQLMLPLPRFLVLSPNYGIYKYPIMAFWLLSFMISIFSHCFMIEFHIVTVHSNIHCSKKIRLQREWNCQFSVLDRLFIIWKYYVDNYVLERSLFVLIKLDQTVLLAIIIWVSADAMWWV